VSHSKNENFEFEEKQFSVSGMSQSESHAGYLDLHLGIAQQRIVDVGGRCRARSVEGQMAPRQRLVGFRGMLCGIVVQESSKLQIYQRSLPATCLSE
jgi:hypothetical protein